MVTERAIPSAPWNSNLYISTDIVPDIRRFFPCASLQRAFANFAKVSELAPVFRFRPQIVVVQLIWHGIPAFGPPLCRRCTLSAEHLEGVLTKRRVVRQRARFSMRGKCPRQHQQPVVFGWLGELDEFDRSVDVAMHERGRAVTAGDSPFRPAGRMDFRSD